MAFQQLIDDRESERFEFDQVAREAHECWQNGKAAASALRLKGSFAPVTLQQLIDDRATRKFELYKSAQAHK